MATTTAGYRELLRWASAWGEIDGFGIEGTGCYGAGLARWLRSHGVAVTEVIRPNRQQRRRNGKSDPADAESAARAVLSGEAASVPKAGDDCVEMIRVLRIARTGAIKARTQAINAMRAVIVTAPPSLRQQFRSLPAAQLIAIASLSPNARPAMMGSVRLQT